MGFGLLYPWGVPQKNNLIYVVLEPKGIVKLFLGSHKNQSHLVSNYQCTPLAEDKLSSEEQKELRQRLETSKTNNSTQESFNNKELQMLNEFAPIISHDITGLTDKIQSIHIVTVNGSKYDLNKTNWNKYKTSAIDALPIFIQYKVINNKDELLLFEYHYDTNALLAFFKDKEVHDVKKIKYTYHLFEKNEGLLFADTFEYINDEQNEFKVNVEVKNLGAIKESDF